MSKNSPESLEVGFAVDWQACNAPQGQTLFGRACVVQPVSIAQDCDHLYQTLCLDNKESNWLYLPYGPFDRQADFKHWLSQCAHSRDPLFFCIKNIETGRPLGLASYLRIQPEVGVIEVGHIHFSSSMQKSLIATEAMYLMMSHVFDDLGYRRYEWKCDALNARSRRAAERFGFRYEGTFKQASIYKGRNRDTAWFAILDGDWPWLKTAYLNWLSPSNFDDRGQQKNRLSDFLTSK